jgi:hypothetical protein
MNVTDAQKSAVRKAERAARKEIIAQEDMLAGALWRSAPKAKPPAPVSPRGAVPASSAASPPSVNDFAVRGDINVQLHPYQREGINFLYERHVNAKGCLLADEMGLGKTVQVSAFIGEMLRLKLATRAVIVAPGTLIDMWHAALVKWGGLNDAVVTRVAGTAAQRQLLWAKLGHGVPKVMLVSYGIVKNDVDTIAKYNLDYAALDEAQTIKDPSTATHKAAVRLRARHCVAISGTPLMNSFVDLWSVLQFVDPDIIAMSRADFKRVDGAIMKSNELDSHQGVRDIGSRLVSELRARIDASVLRREKKDVECVVASAKTDVVVWVRLLPPQRQAYRELLESDAAIVALRDATRSPLTLLTSLISMCNHPLLQCTLPQMQRLLMAPNEQLPDVPHLGDAFASSKITVAAALVNRHVAEKRKTLVFSKSKRLLGILASVLATTNIRCSRLDGDTIVDQRAALLHQFNTGDTMVCLSTVQVGGVGLTFTGASRVIILGPSWNPAVDAQAVDRVHRIGQTSDVTVYRLVSCGTVEEKMYRNQIFKLLAARQANARHDGAATDAGAEAAGRYFTNVQLRAMFELGELDAAETAVHLRALHGTTLAGASRLADIEGVVDTSDHQVLFGDVDVAALPDCTPAPPTRTERRRRAVTVEGSNSEQKHRKATTTDAPLDITEDELDASIAAMNICGTSALKQRATNTASSAEPQKRVTVQPAPHDETFYSCVSGGASPARPTTRMTFGVPAAAARQNDTRVSMFLPACRDSSVPLCDNYGDELCDTDVIDFRGLRVALLDFEDIHRRTLGDDDEDEDDEDDDEVDGTNFGMDHDGRVSRLMDDMLTSDGDEPLEDNDIGDEPDWAKLDEAEDIEETPSRGAPQRCVWTTPERPAMSLARSLTAALSPS